MNTTAATPSIRYYLAPMEGITTYSFRMAYQKYYGGIDKYFTPFIGNRNLNSRERNEILPEHNEGMKLVPQILTNNPEEFLAIAEQIASCGYQTVNLNLGCPSGTVVAKKRGSGFLGIPDELDRFLDIVYDKCPLRVSIKTRIGVSSLSEWENILAIYQKYPLEELIIHPRLQTQGYGGTVHRDAYQMAADILGPVIPLCFNGDIISAASQDSLLEELPSVDTIMMGRGILRNPDLPKQLRSLTASAGPSPVPTQDLLTLRAFHDDLLERYRQIMSGDTPTLFKMKDLWTYLSSCFVEPDKYLKKIRKANHMSDYLIAVDSLFRSQHS